ncbi:hypothetical protein [uncultured Nitrosomonas sp.]|uniref:hypothetical protein n=1 Tax=uncultured Nitrosomonas sp. TaxID=156424 RepID=UPI0025D08654|nr:hypothetical protein [uncultured Nitrosomonas sp.]
MDQVIDGTGDRTDSKLAGKISAITRLSDEEVKSLFPDSVEVKKLVELMEIVRSSSDQNEKINKIVGNTEEFGEILLKLLAKFV